MSALHAALTALAEEWECARAFLAAHAPAPDDQDEDDDHGDECCCGRDNRTTPHEFEPGCEAWDDDQPAPAAGVDQGARLSEEEREALTFALCAPDPDRTPVTEIQRLYVIAAVERIKAEAAAEALEQAADEGELHFAATHRQARWRGHRLVEGSWLRDRARVLRDGGGE